MFSTVFSITLLGLVVSSPTPRSTEEMRIIGGKDINITDAPYQVAVLLSGDRLCSGVIVDNNAIITAAHCLRGRTAKDIHVRVGSSYYNDGGQLYPVIDSVTNPDYIHSTKDSDITILWLPTPLEFRKTVKSIEMYNSGEKINDGEMIMITGWGRVAEEGSRSKILQKVIIPKMNDDVCKRKYKYTRYIITSRMFCAAYPEGGKDACQGDSGGPAVYNNKLAGIVSWGLGCARAEYPGVYTKISALRTWVDETIAMLKQKHN